MVADMGEKIGLNVIFPMTISFNARGISDEGVGDLVVTSEFNSIQEAIDALEALKPNAE